MLRNAGGVGVSDFLENFVSRQVLFENTQLFDIRAEPLKHKHHPEFIKKIIIRLCFIYISSQRVYMKIIQYHKVIVCCCKL